jgi:thiol-disulfide isomerase/thioredoxin
MRHSSVARKLKGLCFRKGKFILRAGLIVYAMSMVQCTGKSDHANSENQAVLSKIKVKDLKGNVIDLNQYKGKTVFINFWATWCGPCIKEMPSIERARKILKDREIEFLVASNESVEQIESFTKKKNLDLYFVQLENFEELNIPALPVTYIINSAGELVFSEAGYREWDQNSNIELLTKIINTND